MSKHDNLFQPRPMIDEDAFVRGAPPAPAPIAVVPPKTPASAPARPSGSRLKQGAGTHSYKHKSENYLLLRRLAQKLDVNIGDLLDEALEAKFPEFKERAGKVEW